tara:strand:- start:603 stop:881 length:279 start_codon:yes stop_codon:yes gene_type:complete
VSDIEVLSETTQIASKDYNCDSSEWLRENGFGYCEFSFKEKRFIVAAKRSGYKIKKGDVYLKQNNKQDGRLYTFRSIPSIHAVCINHDLYEV